MGAEEGEPGISAGRPTGTAHVCVFSKVTGETQRDVDVWICSGEDGEPFSPGEHPLPDQEEPQDEGSNLVVSRPSVVTREPVLLDLSREPVEVGLFDSYTSTGVLFKFLPQSIHGPTVISRTDVTTFPGISSSLLSFRPFSLKHGSRYMMEVTARKFQSGTSTAAYIPYRRPEHLLYLYVYAQALLPAFWDGRSSSCTPTPFPPG